MEGRYLGAKINFSVKDDEITASFERLINSINAASTSLSESRVLNQLKQNGRHRRVLLLKSITLGLTWLEQKRLDSIKDYL